MNKIRTVVLLIIFPLLFGTSYSQKIDELKFKQYLEFKYEIEHVKIWNVSDVDYFLQRAKNILGSTDKYKFGAFKFYFNKRGIDFYKYSDYGSEIDVTYSSIVGVDSGSNVIVVKDPIDVINHILATTNKSDSASFSDYIEIYNKLEFRDRDIEFCEKYDSKIFNNWGYYEGYNHITTDKYGDMELWKLYKEEVEDVIEYNMIHYSYVRGKFTTKIILKYRFPK